MAQLPDQMTVATHVVPVIPLDAWKDAARRGEAPLGIIRKIPDDMEIKEVEGASRMLRFTISTGKPDRDRDVIDPEGWDLRNYKKNPIVMFSHDYRSLPIARTRKIAVEDGKLVADAEFASADMNPLAESVFLMLKGGFLSSTSVGFKPKKYVYNEERRGTDFQEQELLEFSIVAVPSNPECLIEARSAGIDVEPIRAWAKALLDEADLPLDLPGPPAPSRERKSFMGYEQWGFTTSVAGVTAPVHVHDYCLYLYTREDGTTEFTGGEAYKVADHCHRITLEGLGRGETEETDGHRHGLMTPIMREAALTTLAALKGLSPGDASTDLAAEDTPWTAPGLADFTDESWDELTTAEKRRIMRHYAWAEANPPETFGGLKLPHHRPSDGAVVWRAVANSAARLPQSRIPDADVPAVRRHLSRHYRAFDRETPWEARAAAWVAYEAAVSAMVMAGGAMSSGTLAAVLREFGFEGEADSVRESPLEAVGDDGENENGEEPRVVLELERVPELDLVEYVLTLEDAASEPTYAVDPAEFRAALAEVVGACVENTINRLRGRVD